MSTKVMLIKRTVPGLGDTESTQYFCGETQKGEAIWGFDKALVCASTKEITELRGRHGGIVVHATLFLPE